jgi:hypothetical protein
MEPFRGKSKFSWYQVIDHLQQLGGGQQMKVIEKSSGLLESAGNENYNYARENVRGVGERLLNIVKDG